MGNTSGDMDSIVGAMGLAYYLTLKTGNLWTPVVNCAKADLKLKTEVYHHVVEDCQIGLDDMYFWDELTTMRPQISEIALIDHNMIDDLQAAQLGHGAHSKVTYIYDHHFDNQFYPARQLKDSQVRFIGSACSILVLLMIQNEALFDRTLFRKDVIVNYAYFLGAAIALDTSNFKESLRDSKWQREDEIAYQWLAQFADLGQSYFLRMRNNKFNQKIALGFGLENNFRRDYKTYNLRKNGAQGRFGCAVMVFSPATMFEEFGHEACCSMISDFMGRTKLSLFGMVCQVLNLETQQNEITILMFSREDDSLARTFEDLLGAMRKDQLLQVKTEHRGTHGKSKYSYFRLGNNSVSRKKFEVMFKAFYQ